MTSDEIWMQRALDLALLGDGFVAPNPLVGCVIVNNNTLIGEGYHANYGGPHAEVRAFNSLNEAAKGATVYVTLEPCSHFGKTPPCADLLIREQVRRVVIANLDPNPLVAGKGVQRLLQAGIDVDIAVLSNQGADLNRKFFHFYEQKRPWITLKFAESADGFIADSRSKPIRFSNELSQKLVHKLRTQHQAILIGVNTAESDNPQLSNRFWPGNSPIRMVIDPRNRMSRDRILITDDAPLRIFTNTYTHTQGQKQWIALGENMLDGLMDYCFKNNIQSILVEGGTKTLESFSNAGLGDEILKIKSNILLHHGIESPFKDSQWEKIEQVGSDNLWLQIKKNLS
jgi:diaminohydroxyphosphoribosylaminopyrimidine deaminase/5-amino-6-(5-phosphoribosylamino)uracil reductase